MLPETETSDSDSKVDKVEKSVLELAKETRKAISALQAEVRYAPYKSPQPNKSPRSSLMKTRRSHRSGGR